MNEFQYGGEVRDTPHPTEGTDADWASYVFMRRNPRGVVAEWWCHVPSAYWFIAERHTGTDEVTGTWPYEDWLKLRREAGR
jgi:sarcosine oxidase subunit delta